MNTCTVHVEKTPTQALYKSLPSVIKTYIIKNMNMALFFGHSVYFQFIVLSPELG